MSTGRGVSSCQGSDPREDGEKVIVRGWVREPLVGDETRGKNFKTLKFLRYISVSMVWIRKPDRK